MAKSLAITIILSLLVAGVGQIYLGVVNRGIYILIFGVALWIIASWIITSPLSWALVIIYWIWQIVDAYRQYTKLKLGQSHIEK
jgi:TM2 domain-containing membrane protein YozV